jgi:hypothetical protein
MPFDETLFRPLPTEASRARIEASQQAELTRGFLSGEAIFNALNKAVHDLVGVAPEEHDVLVEAFGINMTEVGFIQPHAFILRGYDQNGHNTYVVAHFSQLVARIVYLPKRGPEKVLTGFWRDPGRSKT